MEKINKITLTEQVYLVLRNDIIQQNIKCGEKLYLGTLQSRFNVSSSPIREAMNRLYQDGLLEYYSNQGAIVIDLKKQDIIEIYDFYLELECTAIKFALKNVSYEQISEELYENILLQEKSVDLEDSTYFKKVSDEFHIIFYNYANNSRLLSAVERIRGQFSILASKYQNFSETKHNVVKEHREIYEAIRNKDYEGTIYLMGKHFHNSKNYILNNANALGLEI